MEHTEQAEVEGADVSLLLMVKKVFKKTSET